jgi:hypothetical protein
VSKLNLTIQKINVEEKYDQKEQRSVSISVGGNSISDVFPGTSCPGIHGIGWHAELYESRKFRNHSVGG